MNNILLLASAAGEKKNVGGHGRKYFGWLWTQKQAQLKSAVAVKWLALAPQIVLH